MKTAMQTADSRNGSAQKQINFLRTAWDEIPLESWESCAKLYCQVWAEHPWNEHFWKEEEVLKDMEKELAKTGAEGFIAWKYGELEESGSEEDRLLLHALTFMPHNLSNPMIPKKERGQKNVIGFTWGYPVNKRELREISGNNLLDYVFSETKAVFYIDELAVASKERGQNIGNELNKRLIIAAKSQGIKTMVLRTDKKAVAAKSLYSKMKFVDLGINDAAYPDRTYWKLSI